MHVKFSSLVKKLSGRGRLEGYVKMDAEKKKATPRGFVPVCVGEDHIRYEIPVQYLNSFRFRDLLNQHEEEILATRDDPISLLCSTVVFESVLNLAKADTKRPWFLEHS